MQEIEWVSVRERLPEFSKDGDTLNVFGEVLCLVTIFGRFEHFDLFDDEEDEIEDDEEDGDEVKYDTSLGISVAYYDVAQKVFRCDVGSDNRCFNAMVTELPENGVGEVVTHWAEFPDPYSITQIQIGGKTTWA